MARAFRIAVLASGAGTNLQALIDRLHADPGERVKITGVVSDKPTAGALERARSAGIETAVFSGPEHELREARDAAMGEWLERSGAELIVLAGYMQLLSAAFISRFRERIINVHPALLPSFPGLDAIGQALAHGVKVTGVTVHFVDEGMDSGPIILQRAVPVPADRDPAALEAAIHEVEHELLPQAVRLLAAGRVGLGGEGSRIVEIAPG